MRRYDAVLLIAFGGPEKPADVRPFLDNVLRGRPLSRERYEEVVHHYERIGGCSPMNALTFRQAERLRATLSADGPALPVYVGMRNWSPYIADTLRDMREHGVRRALGIVLAPHRSEAGWERYIEAVEAGRAALGSDAPTIEYAGGWFDHPLFIATIAERTRDALGVLAAADDLRIVFTAHSLPLAMAEGSGYVRELETSCRLVAAAVGHARYSLAYQSRSGRPGDPWLEPDVNESIRDLADQGVRRMVLVPIGFACDHVEVLYDLDVEARATAEAAGVRMVRAEAPNDHPTFVRMLAEVVRAHVGGARRAAVDRRGRS